MNTINILPIIIFIITILASHIIYNKSDENTQYNNIYNKETNDTTQNEVNDNEVNERTCREKTVSETEDILEGDYIMTFVLPIAVSAAIYVTYSVYVCHRRRGAHVMNW
ncbi:hypothetical protein DMN91_009506 [Ooceraea biroi]|uniref:Uncharacterized protein n=1 Tax=Ooceraea biroi TaxID=2015173 RepID=A0A3L8DH06_OOCBI|nr:uncharacterized protein LOC105279512 [Ooceraea biroi]RLU19148.1 hypothetical protein DMN91_009506 [Ooceraea biroi]